MIENRISCDFRVDKKIREARFDAPCSNKAKFKVEYKISLGGDTRKKNCCTIHKKTLERAIQYDPLQISKIISINTINNHEKRDEGLSRNNI